MDYNRLYLNVNNGDRNQAYNERHQLYSDRAYPTTPSTFPQQIYDGPTPNSNYGRQQQQHSPQQQQQISTPTNNNSPAYGRGAGAGGGGEGYFMNHPYQNQHQQSQPQRHPQQQQQQQQSQPAGHAPHYAQEYQTPQTPYQASPLGYGHVDGANGLVHQFAHQNLGPAPRQGVTFGREPVPSEGTRTPRSHAPLQPTSSRGATSTNDTPKIEPTVERKGEMLPKIILQRVTVCKEYMNSFFKQAVNTARERNERQLQFEQYLSDPNISSTRKESKWAQLTQAETEFLRFLRCHEAPENFETIKIIGKGAFGEVKLVRKRVNGRIYALKSLVKAEMFKKDQLAHVRAERDVLAESESPWVVKLFTTFQDSRFLYMLMEFLPGGDLMTMLIKYEIFSEDITRFYMAEIVLAIEAVHKLGFIHRDIKPDNILLDKDGHIKLTDFGLSTGFHTLHDNTYYQRLLSGKSNKARDRTSVSLDQINLTVSNRGQINTWRKSRRVMAYSTVGTPDYIAPEIFSGQGYTFDCDWWSLGTIMFECLVGWPPFCADDPHDTYRKIVNWRHTLYFPPDIPLGPESEHLIRSLICDHTERLGHENGASEVKSHAFFRGVVFEDLRKISAPFKPKLKSNIDFAYFPTDEIDQTDHAASMRAQAEPLGEESAELSLPFIGYTFKRFNAFRGH